jgi:hypothetical protein
MNTTERSWLLGILLCVVTTIATAALILFFLASCGPTPPPSSVTSLDGEAATLPYADLVAECEAVKRAAHEHITRCTLADYVCVPPSLLRPCSTAINIDDAEYMQCLGEPVACSYVGSKCDWGKVVTFADVPTPDPTLGMDAQGKCEALNARILKRELRISTLDRIICVHPDRLKPCADAIDVGEWWAWCTDQALISTTTKPQCKGAGLVKFAEGL